VAADLAPHSHAGSLNGFEFLSRSTAEVVPLPHIALTVLSINVAFELETYALVGANLEI
jgi:hypothetical protein